jgi:hypothetical protein
VLRLLEALRIYGANHHGELPHQLADVTEVPVPDDPITGAAFGYRREGEKAFLEGPMFRDVPLNYEITMIDPSSHSMIGGRRIPDPRKRPERPGSAGKGIADRMRQPWRFRLRSLFIVTTFLAIGLGMIAWLDRAWIGM